MMITIESDKRYVYFIGNQFKQSIVVKSTHRNEKKFMTIITCRRDKNEVGIHSKNLLDTTDGSKVEQA